MIWPLPHLSDMVHFASLTFWAPDTVGFLQFHRKALVCGIPFVPPFCLASSFILKHCFLKEAFIDLGDYVRIPY